MNIAVTSDIITRHSRSQLRNGEAIELMHFRDGKVLALTCNAMALYQSEGAIDHPLGQGLLAISDIPQAHLLRSNTDLWVTQIRAGFIGLYDDKAILITPIAVQLFTHKQDALHNHNALCQLDLEAHYS